MNQIKEICMNETSINPMAIWLKLTDILNIPMHGPVHHIIDGSAFMTALYNVGIKFNLSDSLDELFVRGSNMPGATCGKWGMCGSASSVGAALAIIHKTGPLSDNEYYKDNLRLVSDVLKEISEIGGPRCCKRNGYIALKTAVQFVKAKYDINLEITDYTCNRSNNNMQCIKENCPYFRRTL